MKLITQPITQLAGSPVRTIDPLTAVSGCTIVENLHAILVRLDPVSLESIGDAVQSQNPSNAIRRHELILQKVYCDINNVLHYKRHSDTIAIVHSGQFYNFV